nr:YcaO-like family protein [Clavibacter sp. VKM Ac-2873]
MPAERHIFVVASAALDEAHASAHLLGSGPVTWALLRVDERDACVRCLSTIPAFLEHHYGTGTATDSRGSGAKEIVHAFHNLHDLSIAVTTAYASQDWSCIRPVAGCPSCAGRERAFVPPSLRETGSCDEPGCSEADEHDRAADAARFLSRTRWAFGFASIVGNPTTARRSRGAFVAVAPVRDAFDPEECETAIGKGTTGAEATASCLGIALERYVLAGSSPAIVTATALELERAVDVEHRFDLAGAGARPGVPFSSAVELEWIPAVDVLEGRHVHIPAALALHTRAPQGTSAIGAGSDDGVACRASAAEAVHRGLREVVERDAFRYYVRTDARPTGLGWALVPEDVRIAMAEIDGRFSVTLLDNPFDAPVVAVTVVCGSSHHARSAFGTAFGSTLAASVRDAFVECVSRLYAFDARIATDPRRTDMRDLWVTGATVESLPGLFPDMDSGVEVGADELGLHEVHTFRQLLLDAEAQNLSVYDVPLVDDGGIAVHKVLLSGITISESASSSPADRLTGFAMLLGHPAPQLRYDGPLAF